MPSRKPAPRISIVVATYNRSALLMRSLESVAGMSLGPRLWEAVIVDNNSTDTTRQDFNDYIARRGITNMRMVFEPRQGLSHARNRGINESHGDIIAIIDDDELVNASFAGDYLTFFESHPDAAAAGGKITPLYEGDKPDWISRYTEVPVAGTLDLGRKAKPFPKGKNPFGGNMAVRRAILKKTGLFDPAYGRTGTKLLAGEEKELFERIRQAGGKIYWAPGPEIFHIIDGSRLSREYFERLNYMGGVSERVRTLSASRWVYRKRLGSELLRWGASFMIAAGYFLSAQTQKARFLILMRRQITRGLLSKDSAG